MGCSDPHAPLSGSVHVPAIQMFLFFFWKNIQQGCTQNPSTHVQSLKQFFIKMSYHILVASLTLMALFRAIRVRLATSKCYDTSMKKCFKDWSQSSLSIVNRITWSCFNIQPRITGPNIEATLISPLGCV